MNNFRKSFSFGNFEFTDNLPVVSFLEVGQYSDYKSRDNKMFLDVHKELS